MSDFDIKIQQNFYSPASIFLQRTYYKVETNGYKG